MILWDTTNASSLNFLQVCQSTYTVAISEDVINQIDREDSLLLKLKSPFPSLPQSEMNPVEKINPPFLIWITV